MINKLSNKNCSKKVINSSLGKIPVIEGLEYAPALYEKGTTRIKNKKIKALQSDVANFAVDQRNGLICQRFAYI